MKKITIEVEQLRSSTQHFLPQFLRQCGRFRQSRVEPIQVVRVVQRVSHVGACPWRYGRNPIASEFIFNT